MQLMLTLFSRWLQFSYSCLDRVILEGYISLLSRPANIVYWIRTVQGQPKVTKEFLRARTDRYRGWVEAYAAKNGIPIEWADSSSKKDMYQRARFRQAFSPRPDCYGAFSLRSKGKKMRFVEVS